MEENREESVFQIFIDVNSLKKQDVAEYLGVSKAFITQLSQGQRDIPPEKLALIKQKSEWNTSMFDNLKSSELHQRTENNSGVSNVSGNGIKITNEVSSDTNINKLINNNTKLINELAEQRKLTAKAQEQMDILLEIIKNK